jgi:hypothetical protein
MTRGGSPAAAARGPASGRFTTWLLLAAGLAATVAGTVFALQGFGALGGSVMSGSSFWAAAGPVIAIAGLVLMAIGARRRSARARP